MARFKVVISDPETGRSTSVEVEGNQAAPLIGRKIGEVVDGTPLGLRGHKLQITGGSDRDGFPMGPSVHGGVRVSSILAGGTGFRPKKKGERRRKTVKGNTITESITQINVKIVGKPGKKEEKAEEK